MQLDKFKSSVTFWLIVVFIVTGFVYVGISLTKEIGIDEAWTRTFVTIGAVFLAALRLLNEQKKFYTGNNEKLNIITDSVNGNAHIVQAELKVSKDTITDLNIKIDALNKEIENLRLKLVDK